MSQLNFLGSNYEIEICIQKVIGKCFQDQHLRGRAGSRTGQHGEQRCYAGVIQKKLLQILGIALELRRSF